MFLLPSYVVKFKPDETETWNWRVNTEESLDVFCKILRLNGITSYSVVEDVELRGASRGVPHQTEGRQQ